MENCCISAHVREQKRINDEIESQIRNDKLNDRREQKILLLGTEQSGKSTLLKQIKIVYGKGYTEDERTSYAKLVIQNVFQGIQSLCRAMKLLNIKYNDPAVNEGNAQFVLRKDPEEVHILDEDYTSAILSLWSDSGVQEAWQRRREFDIFDSAEYFLNNLYRLSEPCYIPTIHDILRAHDPRNGGIIEYIHDSDINDMFRIIDVSGQRTEIRKWMHYFENVSTIYFVVSLNDFDQKNIMEKSKALFKNIITSPWFRQSSIILLLNKKDLFEEKIEKIDLVNYFPEFTGEKGDAYAAQEFILRMFTDLNFDENLIIYTHFICATDTNNLEYVYSALRDCRRQLNLGNYDLV